MTLVEVMIAMVVLMIAIAALSLTLTDAFGSVATGTERAQAADLAAGVVAEEEALPWATISEGLSSADPAVTSDPNVAAGGGGPCFAGQALVEDGTVPTSCSGEATVWQAPGAPAACQPSLAPTTTWPVLTVNDQAYLAHQTCVQLNGVPFVVDVYPAQVSGTSTADEVQIIVEVSWRGQHASDSTVLGCGETNQLAQVPDCP